MVKMWHPDLFPDDPLLRQTAEEKFKKINEAYHGLSTVRACRAKKPGEKRARWGKASVVQSTSRVKKAPARRTSHSKTAEQGWKKQLRFLWCTVPLVGLSILWHYHKKNMLAMKDATAKALVLLCFAGFSCFFSLEMIVGEETMKVVLFWLFLLWILVRKYQIKVEASFDQVAFVSQLNFLFTVLFIFIVVRMILRVPLPM